MNVRNIANRVTARVNPNLGCQWLQYAGYTTSPAGKTTPVYGVPRALQIQTQALTKQEIQHIEAMNLAACDRTAYVNGEVAATDREQQTGGDLLIFEGATWLVTAVLEGWTTAGWCKVALTKQNGG